MELDMGKKILWLDDDEARIAPWLKGLKRERHDVTNVTMLSQAWSLLEKETFDLLLLDVMIPTQTAEEESLFPPKETDFGYISGLCFYRKLLPDPVRNHMPVLVLTIRWDAVTRKAFKDEGLPEDCFGGKFELRRVQDFLRKVEKVIQKHHAAAATPAER
jgi:CheY-like chemotaxis protein